MQNVFNIANIVAKRFVEYKNAFIMTKQKGRLSTKDALF